MVLLAGCGGGGGPSASREKPTGDTRGRSAADPRREKPEPQIKRARCPADATNCEAATGGIVFVEAVDADGDGDLHLVVAGGSVTAPGISVFDISKDLRPRRDPRIGDLASAAGPVFRGSFGQRQIQATELQIARR